MKYRFKKFKF